MIESWRASPFPGIYKQELQSLRGRDPIPESLVRQPGRAHAGVEYQRRRVVAHHFLGARVVRSREGAKRLAALLGDGCDGGNEACQQNRQL